LNDITSDLKSLNFPKEATIFLADAKSMYTNIDMELGLSAATITFGHYKKTNRLTEFGSNLLFYRRYINDIFGTGIPSEETKTTCGIHLKTNSITGVT
jgi:hypothetical protein